MFALTFNILYDFVHIRIGGIPAPTGLFYVPLGIVVPVFKPPPGTTVNRLRT